MRNAIPDRYLQLIDTEFEARRSREETVETLRRRFGMSRTEASGHYERFLEKKRKRNRRYIAVSLLSGLGSLIGLIVISNGSDQINLTGTGLLYTSIPALLFSPIIGWAVFKMWRSEGQTLLTAIRTVTLYTLVTWAMFLHIILVYMLFVLAIDFE